MLNCAANALVPVPESIMLKSNKPNPIWPDGSGVNLTCTVELEAVVTEDDLPLLEVYAHISKNGTQLPVTDSQETDTTLTYTIRLDSFGRNDSGYYTCTASVRPHNTAYLTASSSVESSSNLSTGKYY